MTCLLTPISHLFHEETNANLIANYSDELEARERTCDLNLKNTTHYHIDFDLNLGISQAQQEFLSEKVAPREEIKTLTFQMSRDCFQSSLLNGQYHALSRPLSEHEQLSNIQTSLQVIRDIVGFDRSIGVENNNYYPTGAYDICTSQAFLIKVLENNDIHLLLDYAHAKVTCINREINFQEYINSLLAVNNCRQIHFCEHFVCDTTNEATPRAIDAHELPTINTTNDVLELAKSHKIPYITVEYYKNADILAKFLKELSRKAVK